MLTQFFSRFETAQRHFSTRLSEIHWTSDKSVMSTKKKSAKEFGSAATAELLANVDSATRERLLIVLKENDPEAWSRVQERLFSFEDIAKFDDVKIRALIQKIPPSKLALALRKSSDALKTSFFRNLSKAAAENIKNTIDEIGPQPLSLVEAIQREIVDIARSLPAKAA